MADKVELKTPPPAPDTGADKLPEAKVQAPQGATTKITVDTTQEPKKEEAKPERPAWLPEGFDTPEQFAEAYKKAVEQKAEGDKKQEPKQEEKKAETPDPKTATKEQAEQAIQKAGLDMGQLSEEFSKEGKLSEDSLAKLEKAGISRAVVDQYIEGQKAQAAAYTQRLAETVGGLESLQATLDWAATALTQAEITAANRALQSGDEAQASLVLQGLHSRRLAQTGVEPRLVGGRATPTRGDGIRGYESSQEWISDVNNPLYKSDPAFREKVAKRIAASKF